MDCFYENLGTREIPFKILFSASGIMCHSQTLRLNSAVSLLCVSHTSAEYQCGCHLEGGLAVVCS